MNSSQNYTFMYKEEDIKNNKFFAVISYLPLLFIIPLIFKKESKYARFHANQGLSLFVCEVIVSVVYFILKWVFTLLAIAPLLIGLNFIMTVISIIMLSILLVGVMNANGGLAKSLPFIGGIEIIK
ncbi:MAG: hypothetical protein E7564_05545 [Ruminococcaceae bacterium]|nr:hypothetical protein [Oscillospiraceae bacterium]